MKLQKRIDNTVKSVAESVVKYINSHISENVVHQYYQM